ncbi:hypothetical protein H4S02_002841 [Coemansia sp. RSA 2611]|nr:hypothetical protein H4S02_002841 [Coemansia sp. RSA 2611]
MGNAVAKEGDSRYHHLERGAHRFAVHQVIGEGAGGRVQIVEHTATRQRYALRRISKQACVEDAQLAARVVRERALLETLDHAFVLGLRFSFQDTHAVYMACELMPGGCLRAQLAGGRVAEAAVRVWAAELASALNYLHAELCIVHGRVDLDHVYVDAAGHVALGGFGAAVQGPFDRESPEAQGPSAKESLEPQGPLDKEPLEPPQGPSPELCRGEAAGYAADWWALGAVLYACLFGRPPFRGEARELRRAVAEDDVVFPVATDVRITMDCMSALRGLLAKDPAQRLGAGPDGWLRLRQHPFFATFDWPALEARAVPPPISVRDLYTAEPSAPFADVGECVELRVPALEPPPARVELERQFVEFDYIEFQRFRAYLERHGRVSAAAAAHVRALRADENCSELLGLATDDVPLECLTLAGQLLVRRDSAASAAAGLHKSGSAVSVPGSRRVSRQLEPADRPATRALRQTRLLRRTTTTLARLRGRHQPQPAKTDPVEQAPDPDALQQPPSFVPIDALTWTRMASEQQNLARRYCTKLIHENQRLMALIMQAQDDEDDAPPSEPDDLLFQSTYSLTAASLLPAARREAAAKPRSTHTRDQRRAPNAAPASATLSVASSQHLIESLAASHRLLEELPQAQRLTCKSTPDFEMESTAGSRPTTRRMHAKSATAVSVPRLQPIAAAWPPPHALPKPKPQPMALPTTRPMRSPSSPVSPTDSEWDMLPEARDRIGLSSAAAEVAAATAGTSCMLSRKRSF